MPIQVPPEHEEIINRKVASGHYSSPEEVLSVALQLLEESELLREYRRERLRQDIGVADEQVAAGMVRSFSADEMTARIRTALEARQAPGAVGPGSSTVAE